MEDISSIEPDLTDFIQDDDDDALLGDYLKAESVDSALGGSMTSALSMDPQARSTPIKYTEREQELARIIDEIDTEMDDELAQEYDTDVKGHASLPATLRFDTLSTPTQLIAHTNSDSARVQLLMEQLRRCQTQLREAKYRIDVLEVERDSQERKHQEKMEERIDTMMSKATKTELTLKGKLAEQQAENKALHDQLRQAKDDLTEKSRGKTVVMLKQNENARRLQSELDDTKLMLKKAEAQRQEEFHRRKDTTEHIAKLNSQIKSLLLEKQTGPELNRKSNLLEEQVQFLTKNLEECRREHALKLASVEQRLITENNKLKVKEKDYQRKYKREQERNRSHSQNIKALAAELKQVKEDVKMGVHTMDRVKSPVISGEWRKFRPDSKKNKKALEEILQAVESEGGPDSNHQHASDAVFFQMVIYYLWVKRENTKMILTEAKDKLKGFANCPNNFKELVSERDNLKERVQELEERLSDWMAENDTLQSSANLTTTQLVSTKHELELKVKHLQDTVSALHLDNNLLRAELERSPTPKLSEQVEDLTADLKLKLDVANTELKQEKLVTEELGTELKHATAHCDQLEKAVQEKDDDYKHAGKKLRDANARVIELEKKKAVMESKISQLKQEKNNAKDNAQKLEKKLREAASDVNQVKQKQDKTNRARDALKAQIDALKAEIIDVKGQNVNLMQDNETLEGRLQDVQEELQKVQTQLEVQQQEIVCKSTEDQAQSQVLSETLKSEQDRLEELESKIGNKNAKISELELQLEQQKKKYQKRIQVEKAKFKGLQETLSDKDTSVTKLKQELKDKVIERNSKELALKHQLAAQEDTLRKENANEVAKFQEQIGEQQVEFTEKTSEHEDRCKVFEEMLDDKDSTISELEMQIADILNEKESMIFDLESQISDKDQHSQREKEKDMSQLKNLEEHEKKLMSELDAERKTCQALQKSINDKNKQIDKLVKDTEDGIKEKNEQLEKLETEMKRKEEDERRDANNTISDLQQKLIEQGISAAEKLKEEQEKCKHLQESLTKQTEMIAAMDNKFSDPSLQQTSNIGNLSNLESALTTKEATIQDLMEQLKKQNGDDGGVEQRRKEEVERMEELINLEEKMSELLDEKEKMQERMQILSKDKTVLQADKQLLELELADRTKKLQKIMKQSSITGTNSSSRSSSRRSSIDSRSGKIWKGEIDAKKGGKKTKKASVSDGIQREDSDLSKQDVNKDGKFGQPSDGNVRKMEKYKKSHGFNGNQQDNSDLPKNKRKEDRIVGQISEKLHKQNEPDENDGVQREDSDLPQKEGIGGRDSMITGEPSSNINKQRCSDWNNDITDTKNAESNPELGENPVAKSSTPASQDGHYHDRNYHTDDTHVTGVDEEQKEKLNDLNNFVTELLDMHLAENQDVDFEHMKSDIQAMQRKNSSGSNQPFDQKQMVVAKLGALYQIVKAKQRFGGKGKAPDDGMEQTKVNEEGPDGKLPSSTPSRIEEITDPITKEEETLLHSMPPLILEAITATNENISLQPLTGNHGNQDISHHDTPDSQKVSDPNQQQFAPNYFKDVKSDFANSAEIKLKPSQQDNEESACVNLVHPQIDPSQSIGEYNGRVKVEDDNIAQEEPKLSRLMPGESKDIKSVEANLVKSGIKPNNEDNNDGNNLDQTRSSKPSQTNSNPSQLLPEDNDGKGGDNNTEQKQSKPSQKMHGGNQQHGGDQFNPDIVNLKPGQLITKHDTGVKGNAAKPDKADINPCKVDGDNSESYGVCKGLNKPKKKSKHLMVSTDESHKYPPSLGFSSNEDGLLTPKTPSGKGHQISSSRTDGTDSFLEDGDDDVFCDTGVQNEAELERLAILHALVTQMKKSQHKGRKKDATKKNDSDGDSDMAGESAKTNGNDDDDTIKDHELDQFEAETWLLEIRDRVAEEQKKPTSLIPDDETILPIPILNEDEIANPHLDEDDDESKENANNLDKLMEALSCKFDIKLEPEPNQQSTEASKNNPMNPADEEDQAGWLSNVADKLHNDQDYPEVLIPDEEIIDPHPPVQILQSHPELNYYSSSLSSVDGEDLLRKLQPKELESRLQARVGDCLQSANPNLVTECRSDSDNHGNKITKPTNHGRNRKDSSKYSNSRNDVVNDNHSNQMDNARDDTDDTTNLSMDEAMTSTSKRHNSSESLEDAHSLDLSCDEQAKQMDLREYLSRLSPSRKVGSKPHRTRSRRIHSSRTKHSRSDSSGSESLKTMDSIRNDRNGDFKKKKRNKESSSELSENDATRFKDTSDKNERNEKMKNREESSGHKHDKVKKYHSKSDSSEYEADRTLNSNKKNKNRNANAKRKSDSSENEVKTLMDTHDKGQTDLPSMSKPVEKRKLPSLIGIKIPISQGMFEESKAVASKDASDEAPSLTGSRILVSQGMHEGSKAAASKDVSDEVPPPPKSRIPVSQEMYEEGKDVAGEVPSLKKNRIPVSHGMHEESEATAPQDVSDEVLPLTKSRTPVSQGMHEESKAVAPHDVSDEVPPVAKSRIPVSQGMCEDNKNAKSGDAAGEVPSLKKSRIPVSQEMFEENNNAKSGDVAGEVPPLAKSRIPVSQGMYDESKSSKSKDVSGGKSKEDKSSNLSRDKRDKDNIKRKLPKSKDASTSDFNRMPKEGRIVSEEPLRPLRRMPDQTGRVLPKIPTECVEKIDDNDEETTLPHGKGKISDDSRMESEGPLYPSSEIPQECVINYEDNDGKQALPPGKQRMPDESSTGASNGQMPNHSKIPLHDPFQEAVTPTDLQNDNDGAGPLPSASMKSLPPGSGIVTEVPHDDDNGDRPLQPSVMVTVPHESGTVANEPTHPLRRMPDQGSSEPHDPLQEAVPHTDTHDSHDDTEPIEPSVMKTLPPEGGIAADQPIHSHDHLQEAAPPTEPQDYDNGDRPLEQSVMETLPPGSGIVADEPVHPLRRIPDQGSTVPHDSLSDAELPPDTQDDDNGNRPLQPSLMKTMPPGSGIVADEPAHQLRRVLDQGSTVPHDSLQEDIPHTDTQDDNGPLQPSVMKTVPPGSGIITEQPVHPLKRMPDQESRKPHDPLQDSVPHTDTQDFERPLKSSVIKTLPTESGIVTAQPVSELQSDQLVCDKDGKVKPKQDKYRSSTDNEQEQCKRLPQQVDELEDVDRIEDVGQDIQSMADDEASSDSDQMHNVMRYEEVDDLNEILPTKKQEFKNSQTQTDDVVIMEDVPKIPSKIFDNPSNELSSDHIHNDTNAKKPSVECQTDAVNEEDFPGDAVKGPSCTSVECQTEDLPTVEHLKQLPNWKQPLLPSDEYQSDPDDLAAARIPVENQKDLKNNRPAVIPAECQTDMPSMTPGECQTDPTMIECQIEPRDAPVLISAESQTDTELMIPAECQTDSEERPSMKMAECQTDPEVTPSLKPAACQTSKDTLSMKSVEIQTDPAEMMSTVSGECQTDPEDTPLTMPVECQTDPEKTPSGVSIECQTETGEAPSRTSVECQTDPEDNALEVTLKGTIEGLQNLSDKQKTKMRAFKDTAKAYKGEMQRMYEQMKSDQEDLTALHGKTTAQEAQLHQLTHKTNELEVDLGLTRDYLDEKKNKCTQLQQEVYDAEVKERDLASTVKEVQDQLDIEQQIQDKLHQRCTELETELLDAKNKLLQPDQTEPTNADDEDAAHDGGGSPNDTAHVSPTKTAKELQNETDDRKKLSELVAKLNGFEAQTEMDKLTIDALKEENQHLREIVDKLKDKAYSKWKENPDSRLEDIYHALAKAQVKALAMKLSENPDEALNNTITAFGETLSRPASQSPRPSSGLGTTLDSEFGYL